MLLGCFPAWAANLTGSLTISIEILTARISTWRPSIVEPGWAIITRNQECRAGREKFPRTIAIPREGSTRGRQSSIPGGNEFAVAEHRSIRNCLSMEMWANGNMRDPQQQHNSTHTQEPTQPSLHCDSASRAHCRFRCLFNSASSRKHSCSFCQAATPSRVAFSAPFGT